MNVGIPDLKGTPFEEEPTLDEEIKKNNEALSRMFSQAEILVSPMSMKTPSRPHVILSVKRGP